jgi:hypothetical protein
VQGRHWVHLGSGNYELEETIYTFASTSAALLEQNEETIDSQATLIESQADIIAAMTAALPVLAVYDA